MFVLGEYFSNIFGPYASSEFFDRECKVEKAAQKDANKVLMVHIPKKNHGCMQDKVPGEKMDD